MKSPLVTVLTVVGILGTATVAMAANTDTLAGVFGDGDPVSASEALVPSSDSTGAPATVPTPAAPAPVAPGTPASQTNQSTGTGSQPATDPGANPGVNPAPAPAPSDGTTGGSGAYPGEDDEYEEDEEVEYEDDEYEEEDGDDD